MGYLDWSTRASDADLLDDAQVLDFVVNGYHVVTPRLPATRHAEIYDALSELARPPGAALLDVVPAIREVFDDPAVRGAVVSLLGPDARLNAHHNLHVSGPSSQYWHQDSINRRHHQLWRVLAMYYPQTVTAEMGPTVVLPGSHLRNAPTDRLAAYGNIAGQVCLTVPAGSVVIAHFDIWHAGTVNRSGRTRFMTKFLFDRVSRPTSPTWRHDPVAAVGQARERLNEAMATRCSPSDKLKERLLRFHLWNYLVGGREHDPSGAYDVQQPPA
jgi:hypothetical protein